MRMAPLLTGETQAAHWTIGADSAQDCKTLRADILDQIGLMEEVYHCQFQSEDPRRWPQTMAQKLKDLCI